MSATIKEFPIGETQRDAQRQESEKYVAGLRGNFPSAKIIAFRGVLGESAIIPDIAQA